MIISGTVENIIFRNEENCYTVLELEREDTPVVATGIFPTLNQGENVELEGEFKETKYGLQFVVSSFVSRGFQSVGAITRYLSGGLFKGVGEKTAQAITDKFQENTFEIIENEPHRLAEIRGISAKKALEISKEYQKVIGMREAIIYLTEKGVSFSLSLKIFDKYKDNTISIVNRNPYQLVEDIDGVGFKTADEIGRLLGIKENDEFRIQASMLYCIKENGVRDGSTMISLNNLISRGAFVLNVEAEELSARYEKVVADFLIEGKIRKVEIDGQTFITTSQNYFLERNLSNLLLSIEKNASLLLVGDKTHIEEFERIEKIALHEKQKEAVLTSTQGGLTVITGGPGTGKTTIIKCILHIFKNYGLKTALVAPTGRASKRLSESTGEEAKTIHRLLDLDFKNGRGKFTFNEDTKLEQDVLIVDEVSMADVYVMKSLLSAVKFGGRVILVGDKDQLPSVGAGNVLKDILDSNMFSYVSLSEVYRQGADSMIVNNAHAINQGNMPDLTNQSKDFFYSNKSVPEDMLNRIVEMVTTTLPKFAGVGSKEIQILAPMKKGVCGVNNLNYALQKSLNPKKVGTKELEVAPNMTFRVGDKVMQIVNNYQIEWTKSDSDLDFGSGVFNGDSGEIVYIDEKSFEIVVRFEDNREVVYDRSNINELTLSYAISIHKSQGSEFDVVIIPVTGGSPMLYTRNLLYTAITRGKKVVVIMGEKYNIKRMIDNNYIEKRYTLLRHFLEGSIS